MREKLLTILMSFVAFFILLFLYTKLSGPIPFVVDSVTTNKDQTFNVLGEGEVAVKPDLAVLNVGIQASGNSVAIAQDKVNSVINQVSGALKKLGINEADIQTANYSVNPEYDYSAGKQSITGYQANTSLSIKVRNIEKINTVIDSATNSGANQIGNITFDVEDKQKFEDEARKKAVENAKNKALMVAKTAGFSLGRLINYSESFQPGPPSFRDAIGASEKAQTSIEVGSNNIKVIVTLGYEIR